MNADGDYGHDNTDDNTDDHTDQEEDPSMTNPQPEQPAIEPPRRNRGFYAPNLTGDQMNTIWPDLARITNSDNA
ncbi:MAG: hypothetical protein HOQ24_08690, partial [Mycobacteriaceae bacterium]|nr:hypothetical protein [Mycobacteriaceae bacterium]